MSRHLTNEQEGRDMESENHCAEQHIPAIQAAIDEHVASLASRQRACSTVKALAFSELLVLAFGGVVLLGGIETIRPTSSIIPVLVALLLIVVGLTASVAEVRKTGLLVKEARMVLSNTIERNFLTHSFLWGTSEEKTDVELLQISFSVGFRQMVFDARWCQFEFPTGGEERSPSIEEALGVANIHEQGLLLTHRYKSEVGITTDF